MIKRITFVFILGLLTYGVYSVFLTLLGMASTFMNILALVIGFVWICVSVKCFKYLLNDNG